MSSQSEILALRERGWSYGQIGRAVGRDSSLISQIGRGSKPGTNLTGALSGLVTGGVKPGEVKTPVDVARRVNSSGEAARVRQPTKTNLPGGQVMVESRKGRGNVLRELRQAARQGKGVSFVVNVRSLRNYKEDASTMRNANVNLYGKGGYDAQKVLDAVEAKGGGKEALDSVLIDTIRALPNVENASGVGEVTMQTYGRS